MTTNSLCAALISLLAFAPGWAAAASPLGPEPENAGSEGSCAVPAFEVAVRVPVSAPRRAHVPGNMNDAAENSVRAARKSIALTRQALDRILTGMDRVLLATNECGGGLEDAFFTLRSTAEAAVFEETAADVKMYERFGWTIAWENVATDKLVAQLSAVEPPRGRYAGACRAPDIDAELYVPADPDLPPAAREKLAAIAPAAREVSEALRAQKRSFDELLPLAGGRDCRALLAAFDHLVDRERRAYFVYRRKAVAGAVWDGLRWEKISPAR